jgi:hypothetical protein
MIPMHSASLFQSCFSFQLTTPSSEDFPQSTRVLSFHFPPSSILCRNYYFKILTHLLNSFKFCRFKSAYRTALYGWAAPAPPQLVEPASRLSRDNAVLSHRDSFPSNGNFSHYASHFTASAACLLFASDHIFYACICLISAISKPSSGKMLDPLTALSLASNVVQILDCSAKLVAKGNELYKSADGASVSNAELEVIAKDLQDLNERLQQSTPSHNPNLTTLTTSDVALRNLSEQCSGVAGELIEVLDKLKVQGTSNRRWKSVRQALKGLLKKDEVDAIAQRLQYVRDELNLHILVSMRYALPNTCVHSLYCKENCLQNY